MIVSKQHKFIFAAIPKTGTHSIRRALRPSLGEDDIEQVGLFLNKRFPFPSLAKLQHGHLTLAQVRPYLSNDEFRSFFKFAFVRNPFDRFVSYCAFMTRHGGHFQRTPQEVMRYFLANPPHHHILFAPQHIFVCDKDGTLLADQIGRVEQMQQSYDAIAERLGLASSALEIANSSSRDDYRTYYDEDLRAGVAKLYGRDLELFDYDF